MVVTIESKARPCPGVERALELAEEVLNRGEAVFSVGAFIHNPREVKRLEGMGLKIIDEQELLKGPIRPEWNNARFLARAHGNPEAMIRRVREAGMTVLDATCPIVRHSRELIDLHVRDGWGIIIAGDPAHVEVIGLIERARGSGLVVSTLAQARRVHYETRSLLLAQTTVDPEFFSDVRKILSARLPGMKIADTTCRFVKTRQADIRTFSGENDVILVVGGKQSANCSVLTQSAAGVNPRSHHVESPEEVQARWISPEDRVGITGGASTPRWQLEEMKSYLNNHKEEEGPKGSINRKGGKFLWWIRKN
jgi:(E)-4-hydroxy-3-methyl-but-2-enyl pyrophosphate reductase